MKDGEPSAGKLRPTPPAFRQLGQFRRLGEPALDGLMSEIGRHCGWRGVNAHNRAFRQPSGEVQCDGSWADAYVQQPVGRLQPAQQICGGVLSSSPTVGLQDRVVVSV